MLACAIFLLAMIALPASGWSQTSGPPLVLEAKIPLGEVSGRIDHLGIDLARRRLFVAELGNNTLGVVDLPAGKVARTIEGMSEPQGVAYVPFADSVYVANGGDGSVRVLRGDDLAPVGRVELGGDADNVRVDPNRRRVIVGYGKGALAVIDAITRTKTAEIRLRAHPEGFQIEQTGSRAFVNVPDAGGIEIVDFAAGSARFLPMRGARSNFPMAIDDEGQRVLVVFRSPPTMMALAIADGGILAQVETCGDADDVFVDRQRHRVYVSCGEGVVEVFDQDQAGYRRLARAPTVAGARTSLLVPDLDRLFVAVRARSSEPAAIWVFRPSP
jgi:hypothetical protein